MGEDELDERWLTFTQGHAREVEANPETRIEDMLACRLIMAIREVRRLKVIIATASGIHVPDPSDDEFPDCLDCGESWPCLTHRALHPQEG